MSISIGLMGDVMLGRKVGEALDVTSAEELWTDEVRELAASLDLVICNLECCLSERGHPTERIAGKPFFFRGPPEAVGALCAVGAGVAGLANNHALDYEDEALADTMQTLGTAAIAAVGAGHDETAARRAVVVERAGTRVGLVAVADHPRQYAAAPGRWGIAYARLAGGLPDWLREELASARERCDLLIAFPHWGPNMTSRPASWQHQRARELQAAGADLVAGHSAHVFHGVEWTAGGPVLFDLGDALDDYAVDPELRNDLGVMAVWRPGAGEEELELVALRLDFCRTGLARGADADWIAARLERACTELGTAVIRVAEDRFRVMPAAQ